MIILKLGQSSSLRSHWPVNSTLQSTIPSSINTPTLGFLCQIIQEICSRHNLSKTRSEVKVTVTLKWYNPPPSHDVFTNQTLSRVAQSATCLPTDTSLTVDPGVASSTSARSHTFVEIDHEIISTVILLALGESFKIGCCQLQAEVCAWSTGLTLVRACPGKKVG